MALAPGTRLGPYEVIVKIGAGGMGEVYRARDTRLRRDVAIKILPNQFAGSSVSRERFDREARAVAALNHPNICVLHDIGNHEGIDFLVMEYLEGETLAQRLGKGALPVERALRHAIEIADALDKAHRQGIVHRDLKPGNIVITKSGAKLLDFGLAKLRAEPTAFAGDLSHALTADVDLTAHGSILGTLQYMAPEQVEGREADARTDIFAFGALLYEMLAGRKAFEAKTQANLMVAILDRDPLPVSNVQPLLPHNLDRIVAKCLAKDPAERWQSAKDLHDNLKWIADTEPSARVASRGGLLSKVRLSWSLAGLFLVTTLALAAVTSLWSTPVDGRVYRTTILAGVSLDPNVNTAALLAMSPDGRRVAFVGSDRDGRRMLYVRALDGLTAQPLTGSEGAAAPFWSPDGRFMAFVADNKLKKIDASGAGPAQVLGEALVARPGTWNRDDVILFTPRSGSPLFRVSASGGTPSPVTSLDTQGGEVAHAFPFFLPDGRHFLYLAQAGGAVPRGIYVGSLDSSDRTRLIEGGSNAQYAQGSLLFLRAATLMAQPFDLTRLSLTGEAEPLAEQVDVSETNTVGTRVGAFSVSDAGVLVYRAASPGSQLVWFDRAGRQTGVLGERARFGDPFLSPDGTHAGVSIMETGEATRDVWVYDTARGLRNRLTFAPDDDMDARWSPDSSRLVYSSRRNERVNLYQKASSGAGNEALLYADGLDKFAQSWSPDGRFILYVAVGDATGQDVWALPLFGDRKPFAVVQTRFGEGTSMFSPDGRWIAYRSNETGQFEIYLTPFRALGDAVSAAAPAGTADEKWQVSTAGGDFPRWRRDGKEIFYVAPDNKLMAVPVVTDGSRVDAGTPQPLFTMRRAGPRWFYDVSADGQRFLVNTSDQTADWGSVTLVVNWHAGLKK